LDDEFIGRVSHEIRTPLNGILGLTQVLLDKKGATEERELLEMIKTSGDTVLRIINDLLDYSSIQAGKIRIESEEFRLHRLVRQSVRTLAPPAHLKGLELAFWIAPEVPAVVVGNPQRLRQVLLNLVSNAIKFTEEGEVLVEVTAERSEGGRALVRFTVTDTGIGISSASASRILEAFVQGDNTRAEHGGLGLGLTISSELVERLGGTLAFESREGKGTSFRFELPFERAHSDETAAPRAELRGAKALVVDDNAMQRDVMAKQLALLGVETELAFDSESALAAIDRARDSGKTFAFVFLDSRIPGVDTSKLAWAIQKRQRVPAILMALAHDRVSAENLRRLGIVGQLTKPIAPTHLERALAIVLRGRTVTKPEDVQTQGLDRPSFGGLRALVADDHPVNRTVVVRALESGGSTVVAVSNGKEALDRWSEEEFDVLLLDVEMPEMDGLTVAERIREHERRNGGHLAIVALTAHAREEDRDRCLAAGMDAFVAKPVDESSLTSAILTALKSSKPAAKPREEKSQAGEPIFDRERALKRANGDPALLAELTSLFLDETPSTLRDIEEALAEQDHPGVERLSHRLKGALLTLSASRAVDAASDLEVAAHRAEHDACQRALAALDAEIARFEAEVKADVSR
jgi:CheY-like chemotaxis protein/HPt (histidine-containing phosphotransfer) domain-containing protein/anti-sigma regulatory factor (Ser/Thr protein kinase)